MDSIQKKNPKQNRYCVLTGENQVKVVPPLHVLEDVALVVPGGDLEGEGGVVALQHGRVVVQDGQLAPRVAQEGVGPARVVHIVHCGGDQGCNLVYGVQALLLIWYSNVYSTCGMKLQ